MNRLSYFRCDVTPPLGHPLMGGLGPPASKIVDRQFAQGIILQGTGEPIVLLALDWCEIRNRGYALWREALAVAAGTIPQRVFVHTVHQHDAVLADPCMEEVLAPYGLAGSSLDLQFFQRTIEKVATAARDACRASQPVTHVSRGESPVEQVASNRRVIRDEAGKVLAMRRSWCPDETMRAAPEGLIDPFLKTIGFWNGDQLLVAMHYYATHPMSFYGEGGVSRDFCGLARDLLAEECGAPQIYFNGAAGNISAGKYNDGSPPMAAALQKRMLCGMRRSLKSSVKEPLVSTGWQTQPIRLCAREEYPAEFYKNWLKNEEADLVTRCWGALGLASLNYGKENPDALDISCLHLNDLRVLHLPGEPFIEYQLFAQQQWPGRFVAMAGYGDCGPGYIPTAVAFEEGGYETSWVTFNNAQSEAIVRSAIERLMR